MRDSALQAVHFPQLLAFLPRIRVRAGTAVVVVLVLLGQDSAPAAPSVRLAVPVLLHPEIVSWRFRVSLAHLWTRDFYGFGNSSVRNDRAVEIVDAKSPHDSNLKLIGSGA